MCKINISKTNCFGIVTVTSSKCKWQ